MRKTKIIVTIGPSTYSINMIRKLLNLKVDVFRINFSHGARKENIKKIKTIIKEARNLNIQPSIMCDLTGPKLRVLRVGKENFKLSYNDEVEIFDNHNLVLKNSFSFSINKKNIINNLKKGDSVFVDDGNLTLKVVEKREKSVIARANNDHYIATNKGININRDLILDSYLNVKDKKDLEEILKIDFPFYISASFIRNKEDVKKIRNFLKTKDNRYIKIISKIENRMALTNIKEIIGASDGIMIARGDLGIEVEMEEIPILQKEIILLCNKEGKPVIVATHMLESMQNNKKPTRAEVSDVANAVIDGADALMLSAETAVGKYPIEAFEFQSKIALKAEKIVDYEKFASEFYESSNKSQGDAIGSGIVRTNKILDIKHIFCFSRFYTSAMKLSKFKIKVPIYAFVYSKKEVSILNGLYYGIEAKYLKNHIEEKKQESYVQNLSKNIGYKKGDNIILVNDNPKNQKAYSLKILQIE